MAKDQGTEGLQDKSGCFTVCSKKLSNKAEAYPLRYVAGLNDARTKLEDFFNSLLVRLRRGTWGLIVAEPLLIFLVVLDLCAAHPVFPLDTPFKVR